MSNLNHTETNIENHDKKAMRSYVIGFTLSLILTLIPYTLVVNQIISGNSLLLTILSFAVLQMVVQVTFFLHLGRGPKPRWNLFFFIATIGVVLIVVAGSILIIDNLHYNMGTSDQVKRLVNEEGIYQLGGKETGSCQNTYDNHQIIIQNDSIDQEFIYANMCDTLTFANEDDREIEIMFRLDNENIIYGGYNEIVAREGKNETITLTETGTFDFYDSTNQALNGKITINP